jgi:acetate kinase
MIERGGCVLALNAGSSTLRFALMGAGDGCLLRGKIERIGMVGTRCVPGEDPRARLPDIPDRSDHAAAASHLFDWLEREPEFAGVRAVAHRIVHGMTHNAPARVTPALLEELRSIVTLDPEHLPFQINLVDATLERYPALPQVACFDTAFHRSLPAVARRLPIPRRLQNLGIERYGFHGLSFEFLLEELARLGDRAASGGRVILAHLGNGASLAAVRDGRCIDTSMAFTPASGMMMGTRSGDLDPGLAPYLAETQGMAPAQFQRMVNHESGLLGVSGVSSDIRDLLALEDANADAAEAVALFCYGARKWTGAFAAALGGLDTLVFAGGVGENSPSIRERICAELAFLGIELDPTSNSASASRISRDGSAVTVRVIHTDEERILARAAFKLPIPEVS